MSDATKQIRAAMARALSAGHPHNQAICQEILARMRPMDAQGAAKVVAEDKGLANMLAGQPGPEVANLVLARLNELVNAAGCLRCGSCCRVSSPALLAEDASLLGPDGPGQARFYTLRAGEMAHWHRLGRSAPLEREIIKPREDQAGGCVLLTAQGCGVYDLRPEQCRVLECWSGRDASELEGRPRLSRAEVYAGDDTALALIEEYEIKLPAAALAEALAGAKAGRAEAAAEALGIMELDHRLRTGIAARYGYGDELELLLGRDAVTVARGHGLAPRPSADGGVELASI